MSPSNKNDDPPILSPNILVSAKFRGAYCQAKILSVNENVQVQIVLNDELGTVVTVSKCCIIGKLKVGELVHVNNLAEQSTEMNGYIKLIRDDSRYTVLFNDGDQLVLKRRSLLPSPPSIENSPKFSSSSRKPVATSVDKKNKSRSSLRSDEALDLPEVLLEKVVLAKNDNGFFPAVVTQCHNSQLITVRSFINNVESDIKISDATVLNDSMIDQIKILLPGFDMTPIETYMQTTQNLSRASSVEDLAINMPSSDDECILDKDYFLANLINFLEASGVPFTDVPKINGVSCDLCLLYRIVDKNGGFQRVSKRNLWRDIHIALNLPCKEHKVTGNELKNIYKKYIQAFYDMNRKLGSPTVAPDKSKRLSQLKANQRLFKPSSSDLRSRKLSGDQQRYSRTTDPSIESSFISGHRVPSITSCTNTNKRRLRAVKQSQNTDSRSLRVRAFIDRRNNTVDQQSISSDSSYCPSIKSKGDEIATSRESTHLHRYQMLSKERQNRLKSKQKQKATGGKVTSHDSVESNTSLNLSLLGRSSMDKYDVDQIDKNSFVKVLWSNDESNKGVYRAKVLDKKPENDLVLVHYVGWNSRYDQWVTLNRIIEINCAPLSQEIKLSVSQLSSKRCSLSCSTTRSGDNSQSRTTSAIYDEEQSVVQSLPDITSEEQDREEMLNAMRESRLKWDQTECSPMVRNFMSSQPHLTQINYEEYSEDSMDSVDKVIPVVEAKIADFDVETHADNTSRQYSIAELADDHDEVHVEEDVIDDFDTLIKHEDEQTPGLMDELEQVLPLNLRVPREKLVSKLKIPQAIFDEIITTADIVNCLSTNICNFEDAESNVSLIPRSPLSNNSMCTASQDLHRALVAIGNRRDFASSCDRDALIGTDLVYDVNDDNPDNVTNIPCGNEISQVVKNLSASLIRVQAMYKVSKEQHLINYTKLKQQHSRSPTGRH